MRCLAWVVLILFCSCNTNMQEAIVTYDTIDSAMIIHAAQVMHHEPVIYSGTVPCASCLGIQTELMLFPDSMTYRLRETYHNTGIGDTTYTNAGTYAQIKGTVQDTEAVVYELNPGDAEKSRSFKVLNDTAIKMIDRNMNEIESALNYTLLKQQ